MQRILLGGCALWVAACGSENAASPDAGAPGVDPELAWQATLESASGWVEEREIPGMTLAVVVDGKLRFADGVGVRRWGSDAPVLPETRFSWLSVTKMHTAAAAMRLVERGELDLDAPVVDLVPELHLALGAEPGRITMRHILSHTSGLEPGVPSDTPGLCDQSLGEIWASWAPKQISPPGEIFNYNAFRAYSLAGLVVERAAGKPFQDVVEELVFEPAGMTTATFDPQEMFDADHADGTVRIGDEVAAYPFEDGWHVCPVELGPGGMMATATDVARMIEIHLAGGAPLLEPDSEAAMRDQVDTHATPDGESRYGLGLYRSLHHGTEVLHAWAWGGGFRGLVVMAPELRWGIAVAANAGWADPGEVAWAALDRFFPDLPDEDADFTTDPKTWTRYTGVYTGPASLGSVAVELRDEVLYATVSSAGGEWRLSQVAGDLFEYAKPDGSRLGVQFIAPDGCDRATWFTTLAIPSSRTWPGESGAAHRDVEGCRTADAAGRRPSLEPREASAWPWN